MLNKRFQYVHEIQSFFSSLFKYPRVGHMRRLISDQHKGSLTASFFLGPIRHRKYVTRETSHYIYRTNLYITTTIAFLAVPLSSLFVHARESTTAM